MTPTESPAILPTYYVRHPDDSYSAADLQPTQPAPVPGPILTDERIESLSQKHWHTNHSYFDVVSFVREIEADLRAALAAVPGKGEPVSHEMRMRAPNGNCGPWHTVAFDLFTRFNANPDIGDGFTYETRALYDHAQPSPVSAAPVVPECLTDEQKRTVECMDSWARTHAMPTYSELYVLPERYSEFLREICFQYSAGGYNSEGLMLPEVAEAKIRWIIEDVQRALKSAALASPPQPAVPQGYKLVPIEPTRAMISRAWVYGNHAASEAPDPVYAYKAMLAAAPEVALPAAQGEALGMNYFGEREVAIIWAEIEFRNVDEFTENDLELVVKSYIAGRKSGLKQKGGAA